MPVSVVCPRGHKLTAHEKLAGTKIKCPKCGSIVQIPVAEPPEVVEPLLLDESSANPSAAGIDSFADGGISDAKSMSDGDRLGAADPLADAGLAPLDDLASVDLGTPDSAPAPSIAPAAKPIAARSPKLANRFPKPRLPPGR